MHLCTHYSHSNNVKWKLKTKPGREIKLAYWRTHIQSLFCKMCIWRAVHEVFKSSLWFLTTVTTHTWVHLPPKGSAYFLIFSAASLASISSNPTISLLHDGDGSLSNQNVMAPSFCSMAVENCIISSSFARGTLIPQELLHSFLHSSTRSVALRALSRDSAGGDVTPECENSAERVKLWSIWGLKAGS